MIRKIIAHEWRILVRDRTLLIALPVYLVMLIYAVSSGTGWKHILQDRTTAAVAQASDNITSRVSRVDEMLSGKRLYFIGDDARVAGAFARTIGFEMATKPPSPSAAMAVGQSDVSPSYLRVQWKPMFKQTNIEEIASARTLEVGTFDLGFVIIYLYPLLIIAFSYNILSAEKEGGTQSMLLSQPVGLEKFVIAKVLLRGGLIIGLGTVMTALALLVANPDMLEGVHLSRLGLFMAITAAYGAFWFGLAVLVNALGARSATNALALMAGWLLLVMVIPASLNLAARTLYPLPSRIEMVQWLREGDEKARAEGAQSKKGRIYNAELLRKGEEDALVAGTVEFLKRILPVEARGEQLASPIFTRFDERKAAQQSLTLKLKYLSPAMITQAALNDLAENDVGTFTRFKQQVEAYQRQWRAYFLPSVLGSGYMSRDRLLQTPRFTYRPDSNGDVVARASSELAGLLLWFAIVTAVGFFAIRRYPKDSR